MMWACICGKLFDRIQDALAHLREVKSQNHQIMMTEEQEVVDD
jgi:hypothetical protein